MSDYHMQHTDGWKISKSGAGDDIKYSLWEPEKRDCHSVYLSFNAAKSAHLEAVK